MNREEGRRRGRRKKEKRGAKGISTLKKPWKRGYNFGGRGVYELGFGGGGFTAVYTVLGIPEKERCSGD